MRSSQLSLAKYDSDKIGNSYLEHYDNILIPWLDKEIILLELGVLKGGSLLLWNDYFPDATIVGIDTRLPKNFMPTERIHLFEGSQTDTQFLSRVAGEVAPDGFDIIIDDASHIADFTRTSFWHLFDHHLKPNGLYVIEDWGTGYWDDWRDGKSFDIESCVRPRIHRNPLWMKIMKKFKLKIPMHSHNYGMVGFVKQLVDEQGAADATRKKSKGKSERKSKFSNIILTPGLVFIRKAGDQP